MLVEILIFKVFNAEKQKKGGKSKKIAAKLSKKWVFKSAPKCRSSVLCPEKDV